MRKSGILFVSSLLLLAIQPIAHAYPDCGGLMNNLGHTFSLSPLESKTLKGSGCTVTASMNGEQNVTIVVSDLSSKKNVSISTSDCGPGTWRSEISTSSTSTSYSASEKGVSRAEGGFYEKKWNLLIDTSLPLLKVTVGNNFIYRGARGSEGPLKKNVNETMSCKVSI